MLAATSPQLAASTSQPDADGAPSQPVGIPGMDGASKDKNLFNESPEEANQRKEQLRKYVDGAQIAAPNERDDAIEKGADPDSSKDPIYNTRRAARDDDYRLPRSSTEKEEEAITVAACKLALGPAAQ